MSSIRLLRRRRKAAWGLDPMPAPGLQESLLHLNRSNDWKWAMPKDRVCVPTLSRSLRAASLARSLAVTPH